MSEQPRDEKGRFAKKKEEGTNVAAFIIAMAIAFSFLMGMFCGNVWGYDRGYHDDLADNQSVIYSQGFARGMMIADNQNELAKEWIMFH